jgi:hypothetical protein
MPAVPSYEHAKPQLVVPLIDKTPAVVVAVFDHAPKLHLDAYLLAVNWTAEQLHH